MNGNINEVENGIVTAIQDNCAIVELSIQESCESCGARMVCVADSTGKRRLKATNTLNARVGHRVAITEKSNILLTLSFLQYGVPFIGFLVGIFTLYALNVTIMNLPAELIMFFGGLLGLFLGAVIARSYVERIAEARGSFFEISQILS